MKYQELIDAANMAAADVYCQWRGVDIDWTSVASELDAHWGRPATDPDDTPEFRRLVVRELERMHRLVQEAP